MTVAHDVASEGHHHVAPLGAAITNLAARPPRQARARAFLACSETAWALFGWVGWFGWFGVWGALMEAEVTCWNRWSRFEAVRYLFMLALRHPRAVSSIDHDDKRQIQRTPDDLVPARDDVFS